MWTNHLIFYVIFRDESYFKFSNFFCVQNVKLQTCTIPKEWGGGDSSGMLWSGDIQTNKEINNFIYIYIYIPLNM